MKTCLVTGGAGFIGANLVKKLLSVGHHVHIVTEKNSSLWRLNSVLNQIKIHEIDIANHEKINTLVATVKPEYIFHLASYGGMPDQDDQETTFYVNFQSTVNLVNACKEVGFECFINTGSSSEYGIKSCAMKEDIVLEPVSDYGISKAAATQFCLKEALINKLPIYTVRPFSVYGDYEAPSRLIPTVIVGALNEKTLNLSSPHNVRDFIYIDDMVDIYLALIKTQPKSHFVFNAGTGIQSSLQDVVNAVQIAIDKKIITQWNASALRPWEPKHWKADITLVQQILNWHPHYNLAKGIKKSCTWFKNHLDVYSQDAALPGNVTSGQQAQL